MNRTVGSVFARTGARVNGGRFNIAMTVISLVIIAASVQGCPLPPGPIPVPGPRGVGVIQDIQFTNGSVAYTSSGPVYTIPRRTALQANIAGSGNCDQMTLHFGDDQAAITLGPVDLTDNFPDSQHAYQGFGGKKTVTAEGASPNCTGKVEKLVVVTPEIFGLGYGPSPNVCDMVPVTEVLRRNTIVHITSPVNDPVRRKDFCRPIMGRCPYDANGSNATGGPGFPFSWAKRYSLVLQVGSQAVQGGTDITFVTNGSGRLEVCTNDDDLSDNGGAWFVEIYVDESRAAR